ncbi:DUF1039 domain-containing protein [Pandoraea sp. NPDC087047]|uniref:DUF1039 domain-containing protein n=1 Tax=Pandoraea sp. NPDC087047 TaxID=3364390 RepID=UPI003809800E
MMAVSPLAASSVPSSEPSAPHEIVTPWLDATVRQHVISLALAGAHQGMKTEVRAILRALPSLVPDAEVRECLHVALLLALGDTDAARVRLARVSASGQGDGAATATNATNALTHWLHAAQACRSTAASASSSQACSVSSTSFSSPISSL